MPQGKLGQQRAAPLPEKISEYSINRDGLVEARLQIPARLIAEMRKGCVDAGESLGGIGFIEFIFVSAILHFYREKTVAREVFERN